MSTTLEHPSDYIIEVARQRAAALKAEADDPRRRLLIVGASGSGKTFSTVTTCPGPIMLDYDNQVDDQRVSKALAGYYPMWDEMFVKDKMRLVGSPIERLTGALGLLTAKLSVKDTIIIDSASTFGDAFKENLQKREVQEAKTQGEGINKYWLWSQWSKGWRALCSSLRSASCNVVLIMHEAEMRDEETGRLEKYGWLLQGREFTPRIPQFFTDVVRQTHVVKPGPGATVEKEEWLWQIKPTTDFPAAKSRCRQNKINIPASWAELLK